MKKTLLIILLLVSSNIIAQEKNWVINFNPQDLYFNQANIGLEFNQDRNSIVLNIGIPINRSIYNRFGIEHDDFSLDKISSDVVRIAYRHYTSNKSKFGLYYEGYIKEQTGRAKFITQNPSIGSLDAYVYTTNLGAQLGYQFLLWDKVSIDFYFFGIEAGRANGRVFGVSNNSQDAQSLYNMINNAVKNNLPKYIQNNFHEYIYQNLTSGELHSTIYPWIRSGISIGYRF